MWDTLDAHAGAATYPPAKPTSKRQKKQVFLNIKCRSGRIRTKWACFLDFIA